MSLQHLRQLYFKLKEQVFAQSRMGGYACNTRALEQLLKEELGTELTMSDVSHPKYVLARPAVYSVFGCFRECQESTYLHTPLVKEL